MNETSKAMKKHKMKLTETENLFIQILGQSFGK